MPRNFSNGDYISNFLKQIKINHHNVLKNNYKF